MDKKLSARSTQVLTKKDLNLPPDGVFHVLSLMQAGDEPRRIFSAILDESLASCNAKGAALILPSQREGQLAEIYAKVGVFDEELYSEYGAQQAKPDISGLIGFEIVCLGAPLGSLVLQTDNEIDAAIFERAKILAHHAGTCFERQRTSHTIQTLLDRLEVLNELNQLIASNATLERLIKNLVRESAFRFSADVALAFILTETKATLEPKGGYGCTQAQIPAQLSTTVGLLGQVLRMGGHISVPSLASQPGHGLEFLERLGIQSVEICCLEVRGDTMGVLINAFRRESFSSSDDLTRFGEFCQGAAVAIANARNQERIQEYTTKLEDLVQQRTSALEVETQRAEDANRAKSRFLANMSHELRTPLTAIVGYSSVLADGIFGELNEKQRDALQAICRSSDHLKNLIDDVLNLARIESGKEQAEPTQVSVKEVLTQTNKLMLQTAVGKGISLQPIKLDDAVASAHMYVDAKHVHQIIINMMSNAVKYTPRGGKVWIEASIVTDKVRIDVHDTGVGIPESKREKLFERFERGEDAYSRNQEGTGIGLNLTRHLVELNGGRIGVDSTEGKGSNFWIMMPLALEQASTVTVHTPVSDRKKLRLDGLSALIVDDNSDTCEVLRQILQAAGASVETANSVREGVTSLEKQVPDIVLTDLAMPGESGVALIEHVRKQAASKELPIIVLSACAFETDKQIALDAGASLFIPKPFSPQTVIAQVRELTLRHALGTNKGN